MNAEKRTDARRRGLAWCGASILLVTLAQLALTWAVQHLPQLSPASALQILLTGPRIPLALLLGGLSAYALSMICWLFALRRIPLRSAYPMLSLSYALVYLLAAALPWFDEPVTMLKTAGVILIVFGVRLVHAADKDSTSAPPPGRQ